MKALVENISSASGELKKIREMIEIHSSPCTPLEKSPAEQRGQEPSAIPLDFEEFLKGRKIKR
jgi:hypothetical protein